MAEITVSVIVACAGSSTRMEGVNKQLVELNGIPVAIRSMLAFEGLDEVSEIIVSARESDIPEIEKLANKHGVTKFKCAVAGGETRQQSVLKAFAQVDKATRFVAIHDGARPFVKAEHIRQCIKDASIFGGATLGVPVKDTLKVVDGGLIIDTPNRKQLYITQTPQIFRKDVYVKGINFANDHELDFTDDCQLVEAVGVKVNMTVSDYRNIKITTPEDLAIAKVFLETECSE